jgi:CRP-like cAMP-binding protein
MFDPDVIATVIDKTLQNNRILGDLLTPENKSILLNNSLIRPVRVGEVLCHQGQIDQTLYLIVQGEVEVNTLANGDLASLAKLGAGELIGEISALFSVPRIANVVVTHPSVVLEIPASVFWNILRENPFAKDEIVKRCRNRIIETSLRCVPIFADLENQSMSELSGVSSLIKASKNSVVAHEGEVERSMYVICSGTARVYITIKDKQITVALLHPGDYFGEYSLFSGDARSASVSAITDLQLVELKGESFQSFIDYYGDIGHKIKVNWDQRKNELEEMWESLNIRETAEARLNQIQQLLDTTLQ